VHRNTINSRYSNDNTKENKELYEWDALEDDIPEAILGEGTSKHGHKPSEGEKQEQKREGIPGAGKGHS
jgi:hypothetical protein